MTEAEWLTTLEPEHVFQNLKSKPSWRKYRLFAVGCCRAFWDVLHDERSRTAVEVAESYADKLTPITEVGDAEGAALAAVDHEREFGQDVVNDAAGAAAVCLALWAPADWGAFQVIRWTHEILDRHVAIRLMCCVFQVPFRRVTVDPAWLSSIVVSLAEGIYADRAFDRLPILADALQDAGCEDADLLGHCRGPGPHVRGCWVVDLVLGKS